MDNIDFIKWLEKYIEAETKEFHKDIDELKGNHIFGDKNSYRVDENAIKLKSVLDVEYGEPFKLRIFEDTFYLYEDGIFRDEYDFNKKDWKRVRADFGTSFIPNILNGLYAKDNRYIFLSLDEDTKYRGNQK